MLQYEVTRKQLLDKQEKKIEAMEARAVELRAQKADHERAWAVAQRERELAKARPAGRGGGGRPLGPAARRCAASPPTHTPRCLYGRAACASPVRLNPPSPRPRAHAPTPRARAAQLAEEQERDREALRAAGERYHREREMHRREAEEARQRKKEAFQRCARRACGRAVAWEGGRALRRLRAFDRGGRRVHAPPRRRSEVERREKVEEARRETERILAAQEAEVKARKAEMERRDKCGPGPLSPCWAAHGVRARALCCRQARAAAPPAPTFMPAPHR